MSNEIEAVVRVEDIEHNDRIEFGEWGLSIKQELTTKDWLDAVRSIQKFDGKIQWYLGDLAKYAEAELRGWNKKEKDEDKSKYDKLVEETGYTNQAMRAFAYVARRFSDDFRESVLSRDNTNTLSFHHFRVVAPLEDNFADYWLVKASENGWGVNKLREVLNSEYGESSENSVEYIPTLAQRIKAAWTNMKECAEDNEADTIRIQVVKNGHVIEEELVEL